ncbi:hypothetical protein ACNOYE_05475 [Nannocystaceae bacterium ST9]
MTLNHKIDFPALKVNQIGERALALISNELVFLLSTAKAPAELLARASASWKHDCDVAGRLAELTDEIWAAASQEAALPANGARLRVALLMRAASLSNLLRIFVELREAEVASAEQVLALAEAIAWSDLPKSEFAEAPPPSRARAALGWQSHVRDLAVRMRVLAR